MANSIVFQIRVPKALADRVDKLVAQELYKSRSGGVGLFLDMQFHLR